MTEACCPSANQLSWLISGMLSGTGLNAVSDHVMDCDLCARTLAALPAQDELAIEMQRAARVPIVETDTIRKLRGELARLPEKLKTASQTCDPTGVSNHSKPLIQGERQMDRKLSRSSGGMIFDISDS